MASFTFQKLMCGVYEYKKHGKIKICIVLKTNLKFFNDLANISTFENSMFSVTFHLKISAFQQVKICQNKSSFLGVTLTAERLLPLSSSVQENL